MSTSQRFLGGAIVISVLVACASGRGASSGTDLQTAEPGTQASSKEGKRKCAPVDSTWRLDTPVYRACEVDREAKPRGPLRYDFRPSSGNTAKCFRADIEFVVDERGSPIPETARVIRATDPTFSQAVLTAMPMWRFTPANKGGALVKQLVETGLSMQTFVVVTGQPAPRRPSRPTC